MYEQLVEQARRNPTAPALLAPGRTTLNFSGLIGQIDDIGAALNARGLGRGDRVALLAGRGPEAAAAALGIACYATCVPLNASAPLGDTEQSLTRIKANAVLVPGDASAGLRQMATRLDIALLECSTRPDDPAGRFTLRGDGGAMAARPSPAAPDEIAFVLSTSGTTTRSKLVPITHANMCARTEKVRRLYDLTPADRCLNPMPLCYGSGLNSSLIGPLASGCSVVLPPAFTTESFFAAVREFQPTFYTASFTYHQAILSALQQQPDAAAGHRLRFARSGSGPLLTRVRDGIESILRMPLLEIYGATETGTIAASHPRDKRKPGAVGVVVDNNIAIMNADGSLASRGVAGEVVARGPTVFGGYEHDPAINERQFVNGWFRTGDQGAIDDEGYIRVLGRIDEVINRGGEKISPREVDEALLGHPDVTEAICFPVPHPSLHQDIAAAVVLRPESKGDERELRKFLANQLTPFKVPTKIIVTEELPKSRSGKLDRKELAAHFGAVLRTAQRHALAQPTTAIQEILLELWRTALKRRDIGCKDNFFLSGGDSLQGLGLLAAIEQKLQYRLPLTALAQAPTVVEFERGLTKSTLGAVGDIIRVHSEGTQRPLFAIGPRQGHAVRFIPSLSALGADQPSIALQPPGWTGARSAARRSRRWPPTTLAVSRRNNRKGLTA